MIDLYNDDCLKVLPTLKEKSIDFVLTDLPYGTTNCKWDNVIPFDEMWNVLKRVILDNVTPNSLRLIDAAIRQELKVFFPRIETIDINTTADPDRNVIQFSLNYTVKQTNINDEVVINFEQ